MPPLSVPPTPLPPPLRPQLPSDAGTDSHTLRLPAEDISVPQARHAVDDWLRQRGTSPEIREQVALVLSELATNVVTHTDSSWILCATALCPQGMVQLEVHDDDASNRAPLRRDPTAEREGGRGLHIVSALAACWGVTASPVTRGSAVWAQLRN